ncbi:MAG: hypothetical protein WCJ95_21330 [Mariniphaga sp.]
MKKIILDLLLICMVTFTIMFTISINKVNAQKNHSEVKIGVFDSRIIGLAYSRSGFYREQRSKFISRNDSAEMLKDSIKLKNFSIHAISSQHLMHLMVFGSGSVSDLISFVRDKLPDVAKKAGVNMIVSKFELPYIDSGIEQVDVTNELVKLFKPEENIDKMASEFAKNKPIPLDDLDIEKELMDYYVKIFYKK